MLRIAIGNRIAGAGVLGLFDRMGIDMRLGEVHYVSENFPLEAVFVDDDGVEQAIDAGVANIGIVGKSVGGDGCEVLRSSAALLLVGKGARDGHTEFLLEEFLKRWDGVANAEGKILFRLNVPNNRIDEVARIVKCEHLSVAPLCKKNWSCVEGIIDEKYFWDIEEKLKQSKVEEIVWVHITGVLR